METIVIKKIPLDRFIDVLVDLFDKGVDYIDIIGTPGSDKDYMGVSFSSDYMAEEYREQFEEMPNIIDKDEIYNKKLSDDDINDLI